MRIFSRYVGLCVACLFLLTSIQMGHAKEQKKLPAWMQKKFRTSYKEAIFKLRSGLLNEALNVAARLKSRWPQEPRVHALFGFAYKQKKMYTNAIRSFGQAANLFSKTEFFEKSQVLYNIAFCYELQKQKQAAIASWESYIQFAGPYSQAQIHVTFARKRIAALRGVKKAPPTNR